jgi:hypothetical protein
MKYIITEQQMRTMTKRFKKDDVDRGELGLAIEELVLNFFENTFQRFKKILSLRHKPIKPIAQ